MQKFILALFLVLIAASASALTITLNGAAGSSCPYSTAGTDANGNVVVTCSPFTTGVGVASITKGHGNSCTYIGILTSNNGNIQAICSLSSILNPFRNLGVYIDDKGMWAWASIPGGV